MLLHLPMTLNEAEHLHKLLRIISLLSLLQDSLQGQHVHNHHSIFYLGSPLHIYLLILILVHQVFSEMYNFLMQLIQCALLDAALQVGDCPIAHYRTH